MPRALERTRPCPESSAAGHAMQGPAVQHSGVVVNPFLAPGKRKPLIVGHRGVPAVHQENTLAGFRRAISLGLPAVELDVRLTADNRAIVLHDHNLRRLTGSSFDADHLT